MGIVFEISSFRWKYLDYSLMITVQPGSYYITYITFKKIISNHSGYNNSLKDVKYLLKGVPWNLKWFLSFTDI